MSGAWLKASWLGGLARRVYYRLFRLGLRLRCRWTDWRTPPENQDPPLPPALLRFRVSENISAAEFSRVGRGVASIVTQSLAEAGRPIRAGDRVLDFGCGCGRTLAWTLRDLPEAEFHGADVDSEAIDWCRRHLPRAGFVVNAFEPPLPYPAEHFDVIYCVSVFTHLDEHLQDAWLAELRRLLRPGGALLFSVHGRNAAAALSAEDRRALKARGFLHRRSRKLSGLVPDWYHTSWHTEDYVGQRLDRWFDCCSYHSTPGHLQDLVVGLVS